VAWWPTVQLPTVNSDELAKFLPHSEGVSFVCQFGVKLPRPFLVVVDTNRLLRESVFIPSTPGARTQLQELIDAGLVIAVAPLQALDEVAKHLPGFAKRRGCLEVALQNWAKEVRRRVLSDNLTSPMATTTSPHRGDSGSTG
jgi:hypothetical protein